MTRIRISTFFCLVTLTIMACRSSRTDDLFPLIPGVATPTTTTPKPESTNAKLPARNEAQTLERVQRAKGAIWNALAADGMNASRGFGETGDTIAVVEQYREGAWRLDGDSATAKFELDVFGYLIPDGQTAGSGRRHLLRRRVVADAVYSASARDSAWIITGKKAPRFILLPFIALGVDSLEVSAADRSQMVEWSRSASGRVR